MTRGDLKFGQSVKTTLDRGGYFDQPGGHIRAGVVEDIR